MVHTVSKHSPRAVVLLSGGLDSMLAAKMVMVQGVYVEAINFYTGFCVEGHTQAIRRDARPRRNNAIWSAEQLGIKLHIIEVIEEYKDVVINPKHGYGSHLNPCTDCKSFMIRKAHQWIKEHGFDFIITGEVRGQRPMSQNGRRMQLVRQESGAGDRLLRPLSAKLQEPSMPERLGWVDRNKLGNIAGRGRKAQIAMARDWGFEDYAQPAGGCCFLTDKSYSTKLADLWNNRGEKRYDVDDIMMLKVGRHLRPNERFKLIICRDEGENNFAKGYRNRYAHLVCESHPGPLCLLEGEPLAEDIELAARIVARFGKAKGAKDACVRYTDKSGQGRCVNVTPFTSEQIPSEWYV